MNLFSDLPQIVTDELIQTILSKGSIRIERIISQGQTSPQDFWYDQHQHEFIVLLSGAARLRFEDEEIEMTPGSYLDIPAHRKHRVAWTDPLQLTIWLAIHY